MFVHIVSQLLRQTNPPKNNVFFVNRKVKKCSQWLSEDKRKRAFYLMKQSSVSMMYIEVLVIVEMPDCPEKRDTGSVWAFESVHSQRPHTQSRADDLRSIFLHINICYKYRIRFSNIMLLKA